MHRIRATKDINYRASFVQCVFTSADLFVYTINLWEARKVKLYEEPCSTQPQSQFPPGDLRDGTVNWGARGEFGKFSHPGRVMGNEGCFAVCKFL